MALKWGIVTICKASHDFADALSQFPIEEHYIQAIASLDLEKSQEFSRKYQIPNSYGTYEALSEDAEVNIVYISVGNPHRFDVVKMMLNSGKHVVCEKPMTINEKRSKELMILSKIKKVFLMEAMWFRCFPSLEYLVKELEDGVIGEMLYLQISFGRRAYNKKALNLKEMNRGAIIDFGIYALSFQEQIFRNLTPTKLIPNGHLNQQDIDESANCLINYPEGKTVVISLHSRCDLPNDAVIVGTEGMIRVPHFWFPTKLITPKGVMKFPLPAEETVASRRVAFMYLIDEVYQCIQKGALESEKNSHASTLQVVHWMDMWRKQMEVTYQHEE